MPPATVKSPPNASTAIALSAFVSLYIKAPLAVKVAEVHVGSAKSKQTDVPWVVIALLVSVSPPAVYPVPLISLLVE